MRVRTNLFLSAALSLALAPGVVQAQAPALQAALLAGQSIPVGSVSCAYLPADPTRGLCTATLTNGWCASLAHLSVGLEPPASMAPGQFPFRAEPGACVTSLAVPFAVQRSCRNGQPYIVALHLEVRRPATGQAETAWAQGTPTGQNWSMTTRMACAFPPDT